MYYFQLCAYLIYIIFTVLGFDCIFKTEALPIKLKDREKFKKLIDFYSPVIEPCSSLAELNMWRTKLVTEHIVLRSGLQALEICDEEFYPNINMILKIFCTLPVSTATPERSFSCLKRLKSYLRNSMKEVNSFVIISFSFQ